MLPALRTPPTHVRHGLCLRRPARAVTVASAGRQEGSADPPQIARAQHFAGTLLAGLAATCLALNAAPAGAAELELEAKSKALETELQTIMAERGATLQEMESTGGSGGAKAELEAEDAEIKRVVAQLETYVASAVQSVDSLRAQLRVEDEEMRRLQGALAAAQGDLAATRGELEAARADLGAARAGLEATKSDKEKAQKELQATAEGRQQLEKDLQRAESDLQKARSELQQARQALMQATAAGVGEAIRINLQSTVGIKLAAYGLAALVAVGYLTLRLTEKKRGQLGDFVEAQALRDELQRERNVLERIKKQGESEKEAMQADLNKVQAEIRELQRKVEEANMYLSLEQAATRKAQAEAESLGRELSAVQGELLDVTKQLNEQLGQLAAERRQSTELREALSMLEEEYAKLEARLVAVQGEAIDLKLRVKTTNGAGIPKPSMAVVPAASATNGSNGNGNGSKANGASAAPAAPGAAAAGGSKTVPIRFSLQRELALGQSHMLVGSHPRLGAWDLSKGLRMEWSEGHVWHAEAALPPGSDLEFKCVLVTDGVENGSQWEDGPNHVVKVPSSEVASVAVQVDWNGGEVVSVQEGAVAVVGAAAGGSNGAGGKGKGTRDLFRKLLLS